MIFYGQELGLSRTFGFDRYELNFGKMIPHFKKYNSLQPLFAPGNRNYGLDQLYPAYAAVGQPRSFSRALRSSNRYFLDHPGRETPMEFRYLAKDGAWRFWNRDNLLAMDAVSQHHSALLEVQHESCAAVRTPEASGNSRT
jgi:hypothetical protein